VAYSVNLISSFNSPADFSNLFEQYRFIQLVVKFVPVSTLPASGVNLPPLYTWIDQDDSVTPTSIVEGLQNETLRISPQGQYTERTLTPHVALGGIATGTATSAFASPSAMLWLDTQDANTALYYGLKVYMPGVSPTSTAVAFNVLCDVLLQCRRPI
jgi:hypothetical protein